jgi:aryl-alcohol dehydrogenase-like predicted oxidoreductase
MRSIALRTLGSSGVELSALSLGTVKIGRNQGVKYPTAFDLPSDTAIKNLLAYALELGVTTLDTAPAYGISEQRLGQLLSHRQHYQIISKAGEIYDAASAQSRYDFSAKHLKSSLENSLRTLKTDYLDVWLLHSDGNDLVNLTDEAIQTLLDAKQHGWVRSVGASTKTVDGGAYALQQLDCIMMAASLKHTEETALFDIAKQQQKGLILKKIYDSGWALNSDNKAQIMQATLRQLFQHPAVCSAVIGTSNPVHLQESIDAWQMR